MNIFALLNANRFLFSLQYMWKGMLCIFVVIAVIIGSIYLLNGIMKKLSNKKVEKIEKDNR